jgi:hypothetical protein
MVTYNVERFLDESIESILKQSFKDFEFIIVDFGSTDKSRAIASSYAARDERIKLHEIPHCSLPQARATACGFAQGQYIAMMDSDDVSVPDRLLWELEFMEKHPEVGLLGGATEWIDAEGKPVDIHDFPTADCEIKTSDEEIRAELPVRCSFCQSTVLIRSEAFALVGGYRVAFSQCEDYDLWLRIAEHFMVANLKKVVVKYRIHPYQVSVRKREVQTLCKLAAQASASARKIGKRDPLDSVEEIGTESLVQLGVTRESQQNEIILELRQWIRITSVAGEASAALQSALEVLKSDLRCVERHQIADLYLTVAGLYWKQKKYLHSMGAGVRAIAAHPILVGRPLKPLLRWLSVVQDQGPKNQSVKRGRFEEKADT